MTAPKKGDEIRVFYLERAPETAIVDSTFHYVLLPVILIAAGAVTIFFTFKRGGGEGKEARGHLERP